ncbi:MAG: hypothetical protein IJO40_08285 [Thermoguttaceae bacterium]|nr:hypothetical protein [Thermoguttaceae bacterium]
MKTRLFFALKYLFFAFTAFTVPKMIVDSGRMVAPLEPSPTSANASAPKPRSFWPFRFLQASPTAPAVADVSRLPPSFDNFENGASTRNSPASRYDVWNGKTDFNANFNAPSAADVAPVDGNARFDAVSPPASSFSAPLSSPDERSSFARFAESRFAPSLSSAPFASDATTSSAFVDSGSTPRRFEELFRFGHSPAWLVENWPRVDAVATDDGLVGYRVAISTGDATDDLTGVFACYFDAISERRIEFSGQTGDYRRFLRFMQREYGVALSPDSTAERFVYESTLSNGRGGRLPGRLVVRPTRVFLRGAEKSFFEVDVFLERPYNRAN